MVFYLICKMLWPICLLVLWDVSKWIKCTAQIREYPATSAVREARLSSHISAIQTQRRINCQNQLRIPTKTLWIYNNNYKLFVHMHSIIKLLKLYSYCFTISFWFSSDKFLTIYNVHRSNGNIHLQKIVFQSRFFIKAISFYTHWVVLCEQLFLKKHCRQH